MLVWNDGRLCRRCADRILAWRMEVRQMEKTIVIHGRAIYGGRIQGEALVSKQPLMGWGNVKPKEGYTVERNHPLYKVPFKDKVLVFPYMRGSGGFAMYADSKKYGTNPAAMLITESISVIVTMALRQQQPVMTDFDIDPMTVIETGDLVEVNADEGVVVVHKKAETGERENG